MARGETEMRNLRNFGLTVIAAAALMALVGVGTASATELCSTATTPCSGTKYGAGSSVSGELKFATSSTFTSSLDTVTCTSSKLLGSTGSSGGSGATSVLGEILFLWFEGCKDSFGNACKVSESFVSASTSITGGGASNTASFKFNLNSSVAEHVECGFLVNCTFSALGTLGGENTFSGHPLVSAEKMTLSRSGGGFCPETATWTATYELTSPSPLYVV
jgi:hypothetical protein